MTAAATATPAQQNNLQVQKSFAEFRQELQQLTGYAWQVVYTALWNTTQFSAEETEKAKEFITTFLQQGKSHRARYDEFVQRVLLARQYVSSHPGTYIPVPSQWFSTENTRGFKGTEKWYNSVQQTRAAMPLYKQSLKAFGRAVAETVGSCKATDFHYWRSWFIQQNANGLLNLYLSTIANCCLSNN